MGSDEGGVKRRKAAALREDGEPFALCDKGTTCRLSKEQWEKGETNLAFTLESTFRERERERESVQKTFERGGKRPLRASVERNSVVEVTALTVLLSSHFAFDF